MKKEFIVVEYECSNHDDKALLYDVADYIGDSDSGWYLVRRKSDHQIVLMVPMSRVLYVRLVEDREEN